MMLFYIANYVVHKDKRDLSLRVFQYFDTQNKGFLTKQDFDTTLRTSNIKFTKEEIGIIFENIDLNHDQRITYPEFGAIRKSDLVIKECLKVAFYVFDRD
jgi:Ca2+-binding EF-hand superfamily protein